ncbi:hypothetical protein Hte_006251 [Hypoxylon texense]
MRLAECLSDEGFRDAATYFVLDPPEPARAFGEQHLLAVEEFAEGLATPGGREAAAQRYFCVVVEAYPESAEVALRGCFLPV